MEKEAAVMVEKDDWRLIAGPVCGSEDKLKHIPLYSIPAAFPAMGSCALCVLLGKILSLRRVLTGRILHTPSK